MRRRLACAAHPGGGPVTARLTGLGVLRSIPDHAVPDDLLQHSIDITPLLRPQPPVGRICWKCQGKYLEADFANGRCNTCTGAELNATNHRLAIRTLRGEFHRQPQNRRDTTWLLMARLVERLADLEGITCEIPESKRWSV